MLDISKKEVLEQYLLDRKVIKQGENHSISYCGGGVSGTVAFIQKAGGDVIIKQALAKLKVKEEWLCDPNRMYIEMKSNEVYHRLAPDNAPEVYFYDAENYIFGREAAPGHCIMWKSDLLAGTLDFVVAEKAIRTLLVVHNECAKDKKIAEEFADKKIFYDLRISPYIEFILGKHPHLAEFAKPIISELMNSAVTLIHGDYSPKNIMIDKQKIYAMDFEVAHYGHPSFDLAFFSNHFILKAVYNKKFGVAYLDMLKFMMDIYFGEMDYMDRTSLEGSYVRLLSLLMIARVDGKSPAEYLTGDDEKQELVRRMAFALIERGIVTRDDMLHIIREFIE